LPIGIAIDRNQGGDRVVSQVLETLRRAVSPEAVVQIDVVRRFGMYDDQVQIAVTINVRDDGRNGSSSVTGQPMLGGQWTKRAVQVVVEQLIRTIIGKQ
jgi:hypothetical protein